jgi:hypothetical protein
MNKLAASIGIVALGTTVIQAVESSALNSMQSTKPWSISAALRGFYDDNINATPDSGATDSLGVQIEPSFDFGMAGEQTSVNFGYTFSANYYEDPDPTWTDNWSYTHSMEASLSHTFSSRFDMFVSDSFAIGQEPDMLRSAGGASATVTRISGNNVRNNAGIDFNAEMTQLLGFGFGYNNNLYQYDDSGPISNSALLDRMEHLVRLDSNWKLRPQTTGIIGYTYDQTLYTGDEVIIAGAPNIYSEARNQLSHIVYVGAQHSFTPTLSGLLNVGAQYVDYYNDDNTDSTISPYVQGTLRYAYQTTTTFDLGFTYRHSPANNAGVSVTDIVQDMETAVLYGSVSHEIVRHLVGTLSGTGQYGTYNGGSLDGDNQVFYQLGARLAYEFTPNLSAHVSYNYDNLDDDAPNRSYSRNRVFLGVTASY